MAKEKKKTKSVYDPLEMILKGEKITETVKTRRGTFKVVFPLPSDLRRIDLLVADRLEHRPIESFPAETIRNIKVYATLDVVIVESPSWWKKLPTCENCPDDAFITDLYRRYLSHYHETQKVLAKGKSGDDTGGVGGMDDKSKNVDSGAFSDIAN